MIEIKNRKELETWLSGQPIEVSALIAARSALRVTPALVELFTKKVSANRFDILSLLLRATLNSIVADKWPTMELKRAIAGNAADVAAAASNTAADAGTAAFAAHAANAAAAADSNYAAAYAAADAAFYAINAAADAAYAANIDADILNAPINIPNRANAAAKIANDAAWDSLNTDIDMVSSGTPLTVISQFPLWSRELPPEISAQWTALTSIMAANAAFAFWRRWYQTVLKGGLQNWEMLEEIILIDNDVWKAGPEAVAEKIAEIEARYAQEPISKTVLREQVKVLIQNAAIAQLSGDSLALQIEDAITTYLREEECNSLPDELSVLEHLPAALRRLTSAVSAAKTDEGRVPELELSIQAMATEIEALKHQLDDLKSAKPDSAILQAFKQETGKMAARTMWGGLLAGSYMLLGEQAIGSTLTHIAGTLNSLWGKAPN